MTTKNGSPEFDIFYFRLQSAQRNLDTMACLMGDLSTRNDHLRSLRQELAFDSSKIGRQLRSLRSQVEAIKKTLDEFGNPKEVQGIPWVAANTANVIETIDGLNDLILDARSKWKQVSIPALSLDDVDASRKEFDKRIEDSRRKLDELEMMGQDAQVKPWDDLKSLERFWIDYLDYVAGLSLRHEGLDNGICDIADAMIRQLKSHSPALNALVIPGRESTFASPPKTVYLRFPEWTVWSLPLAAHELWLMADSGEVIAKSFYPKASQFLRNGEKSPFDEWTDVITINPAKPTRKPKKDLVVYLGDAFATFTLGPAYAWSALLLDLDPTEPNDNFRALTILHTLAKMSTADASGAMKTDLQQLSQIWQDAIRQGGGQSIPLKEGLAEWAEFLLVRLKSDLPTLGFPIATWSAERTQDPWIDYFLNGSEQPAIGDYDIRFAINAAWKARTRQPGSADDIAKRCYEVCTRMAERPTSKEPPSKGAPGAWMSVS